MSRKIPSNTFVGQTFNHLTIIEGLESENGHRMVLTQCVCGNIGKRSLDNVRSGIAKSCGCKKFYRKGQALSRHPLMAVFHSMKQRCYDPDCKEFKWYGAKGVRMCDEWKDDFVAFYDWGISNGWSKGLEIDKDIKGNGLLYSPDTCLFVTEKQNCNKRVSSKYYTYNGETRTAAEWSDLLKISQQVLYKRIKHGWSVERSLTTPLMKNHYSFK